jgi:hypothetical protein
MAEEVSHFAVALSIGPDCAKGTKALGQYPRVGAIPPTETCTKYKYFFLRIENINSC